MQFLKLHKYNLLKTSGFFFIFFIFLFGFSIQIFSQKKYTVVLDPGHGGKDPGNIGNGYREKKIALEVALYVGKELMAAKDIKVVYTRNTDIFVELHKRAKIANSIKADLFVSIHCDSYTKKKPHGASTFVLGLSGDKENLEIARKENAVILYEDNYKQNYDYDPNSPESIIGLSVLQDENLDNSLSMASLIQKNFISLKRNNRKVKQANFLVLRETVMPSVLIELGFLTNKKEGRFLNTRTGQIKMAKAIAKAIKNYIKSLKLNALNNTEYVNKNVSIVKFRVQIAASKKNLNKSNFNFRGLKNVKSIFIDGYHKYYFGETNDFIKIKKVLKELRKRGFKDAWVVAFKDGKRISIKEALKKR